MERQAERKGPAQVRSEMRDPWQKKRCCLTGPHPAFLKRTEDDIRVELENSILKAVSEGYTTFVSGLNEGTDLWAAEIVVRLQQTRPELHLIAAIPSPDFDEEWDGKWRKSYRELLSRAEYVRVMAAALSEEALRERSEWMVRRSAKVIALVTGHPGETGRILKAASLRRMPVQVIRG